MESQTVREDTSVAVVNDDAGGSLASNDSYPHRGRGRQHNNNQRRRPVRNFEGDRGDARNPPTRRVPLSPQESSSSHSQRQGGVEREEGNYSRFYQQNQHPRNRGRGRGGGGWGNHHSQGYNNSSAGGQRQQGEVNWERDERESSVGSTTSFSNHHHHHRQQHHQQSFSISDNRGNRRGRGHQRRAPREGNNDGREGDSYNREGYRQHRDDRGNTHCDYYQNRRSHHDNWTNDSTPINSSNNSTSALLNLNPNAPPFQPSDTSIDTETATGESKSSQSFGKNNKQNFNSGRDHDLNEERKKDKPRNQREVLVDQLSRNNHECMVCCEKVRYSQPIWSCQRCFNVFHLSCIRKWVAKSDDEAGWRCPSCQSCHDNSPDGYYCFCGKTKNPKSSRYDVPHTCGQVCGKLKPGGINCTHSCNSQCHPGPCPSCEVQQVRHCGCGKTNAQVLCGSKTVLSCERICNKVLNCGAHHCSRKCHQGDCASCEETIKHTCYCGRNTKQVECSLASNQAKFYSCSTPCNKLLTCGHHTCEDPCHPGSCSPCKTSPEAVLSCPCGQTGISEACKLAKMRERNRCIDPIPTCGKKCLKILSCGGGGDGDGVMMNGRHHCQEKCHLSKECPPCKLVSNVKCRCGSKSIEIPCKQLKSCQETGITCNKKCNKKRSCGKHKCNSNCCIDLDHICPIVCQRPLRCGNHKCSRLCHLNPCPPCETVSFDELSCECGASIIYPPVPCGTKRPPCQLPCSRQHACDHPVHHPCHSEATCPPCTVLTEKWCHGLHEKRKNVMCHIAHLSCGMPCRKPLSCKRHTCPKVCHSGSCLDDGEICKLACSKPRTCGHQCGAPCHDDQCPESKCKIMTDVTCPCGRRTDTLVCWKRENEYDRTVTWEYHKELKRLEEEMAKTKKDGQVPAVVVTDDMKTRLMNSFKEKIAKSQVLECDKECAKLERNRKLAEALQLEHADTTTTSIGTPNYSEFLTKFAKKNPQFIETVHKQLTDLVLKAKQSTKKNLTYGFNSMNRDKRHVIHEYSDHFGMLSESFDEEPNRNVVCFASKEKSYLPTVSLIDAVFRPLAVRSERLKPNDDVTFRPERRTQIVGPSNWGMPKAKSASSSQSKMVTLNIPGASAGSSDFPPL